MHEVLAAGSTGLWAIHLNLKTGEGQMMANVTMLSLLGLERHPSPRECYDHWHSRIEKNAVPLVTAVVEKMIATGLQHEVQYPWLHPKRGYIFVRCGGKVRARTEGAGDDGCVRFMGYHQDVTELEVMRKQLQASLTRLENVSKLSDQLIRLNEEYRTLAYMDVLTGLPNRRAFFERGENLLASLPAERRHACLIMADIDHFKVINDTYTHPRGDEVLKEVAHRLQATLRKDEICARIGGEEFAILLPDADLTQAVRVAERLRRYCDASPVRTSVGLIPVTVSFGVACVGKEPSVEGAMQDAFQRADKALYHAKQTGRNRVCLHSEDGVGELPSLE